MSDSEGLQQAFRPDYKDVIGLFAGTVADIIEIDGERGKAAACTLAFFTTDDRYACRTGNSVDNGLVAGYNIIRWYIDHIAFRNTIVGHGLQVIGILKTEILVLNIQIIQISGDMFCLVNRVDFG